MGMIAIGAGGLDVACAMAGMPYAIVKPKIVGVQLKGRLKSGVSAKDVIIHLLRLLTVKGGVNKIMEYYGEGVASLSVPERATICNMGAELGATTSVFPSDERTREFLALQGRQNDFKPFERDADSTYDEDIIFDLSEVVPLASCPHSPDNVKPVSELSDLKVDQVLIGSCTNSSYSDLAKAASILRGKKVHKDVSLGIAPGSLQVLKMITDNGILRTFLDAGARILETACGPCIGMGQSPKTNAVSLRTFNRNFHARSGTVSANVYLVSPETAAASALAGHVASAEGLDLTAFDKAVSYPIDSSLLIFPDCTGEVEMGPNIKPLPDFDEFENGPAAISDGDMRGFSAKVMARLGDNITTDDIMPAGADVLPYRSNIDKISEFVFCKRLPDFVGHCKEWGGNGVIIAGSNYGQGSSREHAAIAPRYLGIRAVIAVSFARIHRKNLINFGILPIECKLPDDFSAEASADTISIMLNREKIRICASNGKHAEVANNLTDEEYELVMCGGLLNKIRKGGANG